LDTRRILKWPPVSHQEPPTSFKSRRTLKWIPARQCFGYQEDIEMATSVPSDPSDGPNANQTALQRTLDEGHNLRAAHSTLPQGNLLQRYLAYKAIFLSRQRIVL